MAIQIELTPVESSQFVAVGYDAESETLAIRFNPSKTNPNGALYYYEHLPEEIYEDFVTSDSLGGYFRDHIKDNMAYPYAKIESLEQREIHSAPATIPEAAVPDLPEDPDELRLRALEVSDQAKMFLIQNPEQYEAAAIELKRVVAERKIAQMRVDRIKKPAYQTYQEALQLEKDVIHPYDQAEHFFKHGMSDYRAREDAERRRKEAALAAEARRQAEEEAKRKAKELAESDARILEARGEPEMAAQVRSAPLPLEPARVEPVILQRQVPKVQGIVEKVNWTFRITDPDLVPREYMSIDESKIRAVVKALKQQTRIPGIEVFAEATTQVRA